MALMCFLAFPFSTLLKNISQHHGWISEENCLTNANAQRTNLTVFYDRKNAYQEKKCEKEEVEMKPEKLNEWKKTKKKMLESIKFH